MTQTPAPIVAPSRLGWWVETFYAIAILALLVRVGILFFENGYLPQPFFFEPGDTFMDWYNSAYWARDPGAYDSWRTIYPPLTFVVLRLIGIDSCYASNEGLPSRDCDWVGIAAILFFFVINIILCFLTFHKIDRRTAVQRTIALGLGMPMLFALERGNVLLLTFPCMLLAFAPLLKSARLRWLAAGLAINFKVYLVAAFAVQIIKRRWRWTEGAAIATIGVYLLSYIAYGAGSPIEIYKNIYNYSSGFVASQVLDIYYSVTYQPLTSLLSGMSFPIMSVVGSDVTEIGLLVITIITRVGQGMILIALVACSIRPKPISPIRLAGLGMCLALISSEAGGYTQIMVMLFVFMERWKGIALPIALVCCYVLALPGEIVIGLTPQIWRESWLSEELVQINIGVGLGFFLRPGLLVLIGIALAATTIRDVWLEIERRGWSNRLPHRAALPAAPAPTA
ncbi:MAG: hypothetical protein ACKO1N_08245 [Erythrobacter sp.]